MPKHQTWRQNRFTCDWILSFDGKSLSDDRPFAVKKDGGDFDEFSGATITPRATVNAVAKILTITKQTVQYFGPNLTNVRYCSERISIINMARAVEK